MPIVEHLVPSANVRQLMDIGVKPPPRDLLQLTGVAHVAALLTEFGALTTHANDIFDNLIRDSSAAFTRIRKLSDKVSDVGRRMSRLSDAEIASKKFVKTAGLTELQRKSMFMFMPPSTPNCLRQRYNMACPMPDLTTLDQYTNDEKKCSSKYSHPEFFIEQWLISEKQRQKEAEVRRLKKREDRRARRKKEGEKKGKKQGTAGQRIAVKAVQKKIYNVHGQEFTETTIASPTATSMPHPEKAGSELDMSARRSSLSNFNASMAESALDPSASDAEASRTSVLQPPPLNPESPGIGGLDAAPLAPPPPPPPLSAPLPPPLPPTGGVIPPPPPIPGQPPTPLAAPGRAALLQSIQHGAELKHVEPPPKATTRDNLLDQIRKGRQLRPMTQTEKPAANDVGPYSEIKKLLDRRQFLSPEQSDSDQSDGYDSDEWD